ncbi:hypothetical protein Y032_0042g614 [Ancylostoma ceylanicum]|uniref:EF-hand domain-containing protein n=1 Tax=Ancylostoma ceylanicum TaxID=53326 RepID=A0A016UH57_9BILA|nr:hypothetical protein Y032_0042g614 [Ancylostoma ceylanicum]
MKHVLLVYKQYCQQEEKFLRVDSNKDKKLDFNEFLHMELAYVDAKREEFDSLDKDKDGIVTQKEYEEHYHGVTSRSEARRSEYFAKVFQDFDEDFDMSLNQDEMERVLAERFLVKPRENFPKLFYSFDHDHSGGLDLTEYMKFDAEFPFDQTDPITGDMTKKQKPAGRKNSNRGPAMPISAQLDGRDAEAVAQVMAQASPTLAKNTLNKAAAPSILSARQEIAPASGPGLHPVEPGPSRPALPIRKLVKAAKAI